MVRQVAFLMRASKGGLTHGQIMALTWRQFGVYLDSFSWLMGEESEEGRQRNLRYDHRATRAVPGMKDRERAEVEEVKRKLEAWKARQKKA